MSDNTIERVEQAIAAVARGEMIILIDAEERENEGDIVMAADKVTAEAINFMATHARGLICLTLTGSRIDQLGIPMMVNSNSSPFGTAFTVSIEAAHGVTTGISAADRAKTIQVAVASDSKPGDIVMPGHIFPLRARDGGVLVRTGQTEGSVDLARMAGLTPAGVICEIMNDDGTMARLPDLQEFSKKHNMPLISVADLITYRLQRESLVELLCDEPLPTEYDGSWRVKVFRSLVDDAQHLCFVCGIPSPDTPTMVRVQPRTDAFDIFLHKDNKSQGQLQRIMKTIGEQGTGVVVYLDKPEVKALDLVNQYVKGDHPVQTPREDDINQPEPILRSLGIGAQILSSVGVGKMRVLTNRPKKIIGADGYGLEIVEQLPIPR